MGHGRRSHPVDLRRRTIALQVVGMTMLVVGTALMVVLALRTG